MPSIDESARAILLKYTLLTVASSNNKKTMPEVITAIGKKITKNLPQNIEVTKLEVMT